MDGLYRLSVLLSEARNLAFPSGEGGPPRRWMRRSPPSFAIWVKMIYKHNKNNVSNAQILRKNMTPEEKHLWYDFLKKLPFTVNRQKNIGNYIVDFFIASKRVVIEIDGRQHGLEENKRSDAIRDSELTKLGIKVLRYKNKDINQNFNSVCEDILRNLDMQLSDLK